MLLWVLPLAFTTFKANKIVDLEPTEQQRAIWISLIARGILFWNKIVFTHRLSHQWACIQVVLIAVFPWDGGWEGWQWPRFSWEQERCWLSRFYYVFWRVLKLVIMCWVWTCLFHSFWADGDQDILPLWSISPPWVTVICLLFHLLSGRDKTSVMSHLLCLSSKLPSS